MIAVIVRVGIAMMAVFVLTVMVNAGYAGVWIALQGIASGVLIMGAVREVGGMLSKNEEEEI